MLRRHRLPGLIEARSVQALNVDTHLVDVISGLLIGAVKQHPLLHRRQRVDVLDFDEGHRQGVELRLVQVAQGEIRRRPAEGTFGYAVINQILQFPSVFGCQAFDRRDLEHGLAEGPVQAQLAFEYLPIDR